MELLFCCWYVVVFGGKFLARNCLHSPQMCLIHPQCKCWAMSVQIDRRPWQHGCTTMLQWILNPDWGITISQHGRCCRGCWKHPSPSLTCTLEIPQKLQHKFLLSTIVIFTYELPSQTELFSNYELFMYFCFCFFFHSYGYFNHTNSTSLSFSESPELFVSTLLLSQLIDSALSSARCHF